MHPFPSVKFVFLDRDGVINHKAPEGEYVSSWNEFHILPGVEAAIASLNRSGRRVIVVSNQRGIALGRYTGSDVDRVHQELQRHLARFGAHIDAFYFCPHNKGECDCRKPKTGLFQQAFLDFPGASAANSLMIGDSLSDIEAGRNLGLGTIFIQKGLIEENADTRKAAGLADATAVSLQEAIAAHLNLS